MIDNHQIDYFTLSFYQMAAGVLKLENLFEMARFLTDP